MLRQPTLKCLRFTLRQHLTPCPWHLELGRLLLIAKKTEAGYFRLLHWEVHVVQVYFHLLLLLIIVKFVVVGAVARYFRHAGYNWVLRLLLYLFIFMLKVCVVGIIADLIKFELILRVLHIESQTAVKLALLNLTPIGDVLCKQRGIFYFIYCQPFLAVRDQQFSNQRFSFFRKQRLLYFTANLPRITKLASCDSSVLLLWVVTERESRHTWK